MKTAMNLAKIHTMVAVAICACFNVRAEDPYLQSDGTQYIDTGYVGKPTTRVEIDMQLLAANSGSDQYLFGWHGAVVAGALYMGGYVDQNGKYRYNCQSNSCDWANTSFSSSTDRRTIVLDAFHDVFKVLDSAGSELVSQTIAGKHLGGEVLGTMPVFASRFSNGNITGKSAFRLFACRIYEQDELMHDFRPYVCSGAQGLRDQKTGRFVIATLSSGGSDLFVGGDILSGDDPYLQSDGTQFIDTLYYGTSNTCVEVDFALLNTAIGKDQYIFGASGTSSDMSTLFLGMYVNGSGAAGWNFKRGSGNWGNFGVTMTTERRTFIFDGFNSSVKVCRFNRVLVDKNMGTDHANAVTIRTLPVFGYRNNSAAVTSRAAMKLYGMKIYESGELVRNFVPCMKGGEPGLYDMCGKMFYTDWATNDAERLVLHGDYMTLSSDPYIHGDGSVYIDTGYKANVHTRIEMDYQIDSEAIANGKSRYVFGPTYASTGNLSFSGYIAGNNVYGYGAKKGAASWTGMGVTPTIARERFVLDMTGVAEHYVSGARDTRKTFTPNYTDSDAAETYHTVTLFGNRADSSASSVSGITPMRLYSCRIYETNTLVRNYIPYIKNSLAGLKDTVTGGFCEPKSSSGMTRTFTAGGAVESEDEEGAYLLSDGTQAINTGYSPSLSSRIEVDFALVEHSGYGERVFGATVGGDLRIGLYGGGSTAGKGNFFLGYGNCEVRNVEMSLVNVRRHTITVDFTNGDGTVSFTTSGESGESYGLAWTKPSADITAWPMGLFAEPADAAFSAAQNFAKMKLYAVKVYESDRLVRHYLPYGTGASPGLKDVVTGATFTDCAGSSTQFAIGGCGFGDDHSVFAVAPSNTVIGSSEREARLSVFAPGAVAYQWLENGEPIAGETGEILTVEWARDRESVLYAVRATFNRYGVETSVVSNPVTVKRNPAGIVISYR